MYTPENYKVPVELAAIYSHFLYSINLREERSFKTVQRPVPPSFNGSRNATGPTETTTDLLSCYMTCPASDMSRFHGRVYESPRKAVLQEIPEGLRPNRCSENADGRCHPGVSSPERGDREADLSLRH